MADYHLLFLTSEEVELIGDALSGLLVDDTMHMVDMMVTGADAELLAAYKASAAHSKEVVASIRSKWRVVPNTDVSK